jgi:hypothetical protein
MWGERKMVYKQMGFDLWGQNDFDPKAVVATLVDEHGCVKPGTVLDVEEGQVRADTVFNDRMYEIGANILQVADVERDSQGASPYIHAQRVIATAELAREFVRAREMKRDSGGNAAEDHWSLVPEILVTKLGITGIPSILAALCHDVLEDCAKIKDYPDAEKRKTRIEALAKDLINTDLYRHLIADFSDELKDFVGSALTSMVGGMTKVKATTSEETTQQTFEHMAKVLIDHLRTVLVKIADRIANLRTLTIVDPETGEEKSVFKNPTKHLDICRETMRIYVEMSKVLRTREATREMVYWCVHYLNPQLEKDFDDAGGRKRPSKKLDNYEGRIDNRIAGIEAIKDIDVRSTALSDYILRGRRRDVETTNFEELPIHPQDPMEEVVLLVDGLAHGQDRMIKIRDTLRQVVDSCEHPDHCGRYRFKGNKVGNHGLSANLYNPELGGWITIRVNDQWSESRLKRGVLFHRDQSENVEKVQLDIRSSLVLAASNRGITFEAAAQREVFGENFFVYTPEGDLVEMKVGESAVDFIRKVHTGMLKEADYLIEYEDGDFDYQWGNVEKNLEEGRRVDLFEQLVPGKVYKIIKKPKSVPTPAFYLFAGRDGTREDLRTKLYQKENESTRLETAQLYVRNLEDMFGLKRGKLKKRVVRGLSGNDLKQRWFAIVYGKYDPLEDVAAIFATGGKLLSSLRRGVDCREDGRRGLGLGPSIALPSSLTVLSASSGVLEGTQVRVRKRRVLDRGLRSLLAQRQADDDVMYPQAKLKRPRYFGVRAVLKNEPKVLSRFTDDCVFEGRAIQIEDLDTRTSSRDVGPGKAKVVDVVFDPDYSEISLYDFLKFLVFLNHKHGATLNRVTFEQESEESPEV